VTATFHSPAARLCFHIVILKGLPSHRISLKFHQWRSVSCGASDRCFAAKHTTSVALGESWMWVCCVSALVRTHGFGETAAGDGRSWTIALDNGTEKESLQVVVMFVSQSTGPMQRSRVQRSAFPSQHPNTPTTHR